MSETPIPLSKSIQWRLECLTYGAVERIAACLPGSWVFHLGGFFGGIAWHLMPGRRKIIVRNLRIAYAGEKDLAEIRKLAKATMRRAGANLLSAAHTASLRPERLRKVLRVVNMEMMEEALNKKRGVVLLLAHMGNWELLSRLTHFLPEGAKLGGFYRPLNNELMNDRVLARREADGARMFSKRDPFHQVTGFMRDGGIVGILADQRMAFQGDVVHFFGRLTRASPLPSLLARRSKSAVLALSLTTDRPGKWKAEFLPVESPPTTAHCMAALEEAMRAGLEDVFWLQERWKVRLSRKFSVSRLIGKEAGDGRKPHRALLWLVDTPSSCSVADSWRHLDVVYEAAIAPGASLPSWLPEKTRIHEVGPNLSQSEYQRAIVSIDQSAELPLDFVLIGKASRGLAKACGRQVIPVFPATW